jgi:hypothetical protein
MIGIDPNEVSCSDTAEGAALGLLGLMTGISEEYWCAGWMSGLEYDLWRIEAGKGYGQGSITDRQGLLLRELSAECDGWWYWDKDKGPKFIRMDAWLKKIKAPIRTALTNGNNQ